MESVVTSVLNALLGQYVDGLNNLNLSVTSGDIELENLAIKKEALQDLKLPIYVKSGASRCFSALLKHSGFLGKLRINIPWSNLKHMPTVISLERIFLIIGAKTISTVLSSRLALTHVNSMTLISRRSKLSSPSKSAFTSTVRLLPYAASENPTVFRLQRSFARTRRRRRRSQTRRSRRPRLSQTSSWRRLWSGCR